MSEPIKIFIGTEPKTEIPCQVLEYSIRKHASLPVEIERMIGPWWDEKVPNIRQGTGFSLRRWLIPERCGFTGKAIYMDADQLVFSDIAELWNIDHAYPNPNATVWCTYDKDKYGKRLPGKPHVMQSSVMLIDCEKASYWHYPEIWDPLIRNGGMSYQAFMHGEFFRHGQEEIQKITNYWNHFNEYEEGKTKLIHYTVERTQPWYSPGHKFRHLWAIELEEAIVNGKIDRESFVFALKRFGRPDPGDRRKTFGIHPKFSKLVEKFP